MSRLDEELQLLRNWFGSDVEFRAEGQWVRLPRYRLPPDGWADETAEICFQIPDPPGAPYGFYARSLHRESTRRSALATPGIGNYSEPAETPWGSDWGKFSWQLEDFRVAEPLGRGSTMLDFARSFWSRFLEGP
jgi:hypothetical protein